MQRAFVIRGFGVKKDSAGREVDFEQVHNSLIAPALTRCGLAGGTTGEVVDAGNIRADMFALILEADLVICDITVHNANVFYELGIRHALRKKHTVLLKGDPSADTTPFDLSTDRYLKYPLANPGEALQALVDTLQATRASDRVTDSPIFLLLPTLKEADPAAVISLPLTLAEEVDRAKSAKSAGWLRLLAKEVLGQRFQWVGLRHIGRAQWDLKDIDGACESWEHVRTAFPDDVAANLALANLFERKYRVSDNEVLLEKSNQAIRRVLAAKSLSQESAGEALALEARNLKSLWRRRLTKATDSDAALQAGLDARAWQSYESYRAAFDCDLNNFYPGLAALQMGHIVRRLADLPGWAGMLGGSLKAQRALEDLELDLPALAQVVDISIARGLKKVAGEDLLWAKISAADLLFLTTDERVLLNDPTLVVQAYKNANPEDKRFAWDAASGQLRLFAQLGIRAPVVEAVLRAFGESPTDHVAHKHLVVFAGHRIDAAGSPGRFPAASEAVAKKKIAERLQQLKQEGGDGNSFEVLASAAPGADLLVHEVCSELGIKCRLCLPMPAKNIAEQVFTDGDHWRRRYWSVVRAQEKQRTLLQLGDGDALPSWLQGRAGTDPWERGNRWVMHMAQAWGAHRLTLLVLWDGVDDIHTGGTAHMVRLARAIGQFEIDVIDSRTLLT